MDNDLLWIRKIITSRDNFSEDIDMVVIKEEAETDNSLKRKLKKVTSVLEVVMTEIPDHPLENKRGKIRKIVYGYDKVGVKANVWAS